VLLRTRDFNSVALWPEDSEAITDRMRSAERMKVCLPIYTEAPVDQIVVTISFEAKLTALRANCEFWAWPSSVTASWGGNHVQ